MAKGPKSVESKTARLAESKTAKSAESKTARLAVEAGSRMAIYPGSFDPITLGHVDIIERVSRMFETVVVLIAESPDKQSLFTAEERKSLIEISLSHLKNIEVDIHEGLTIDYAHRRGAKVLARGLRAVVDFEYEVSMANMNAKLAPDIETILVFARPEFYFLSSRSVKEVARHGGDLDELVPRPVKEALLKVFKKGKSK